MTSEDMVRAHPIAQIPEVVLIDDSEDMAVVMPSNDEILPSPQVSVEWYI